MTRGPLAVYALLLLLTACHSYRTIPADLEGAYEASVRHLVAQYDALPEQFDDPIGRTYCIACQTRPNADAMPFSPAFMSRLTDLASVKPAGYCDRRDGRLIILGQIKRTGPSTAELWTLSKVTSRTGYATCLITPIEGMAGWDVTGECKDGAIFN